MPKRVDHLAAMPATLLDVPPAPVVTSAWPKTHGFLSSPAQGLPMIAEASGTLHKHLVLRQGENPGEALAWPRGIRGDFLDGVMLLDQVPTRALAKPSDKPIIAYCVIGGGAWPSIGRHDPIAYPHRRFYGEGGGLPWRRLAVRKWPCLIEQVLAESAPVKPGRASRDGLRAVASSENTLYSELLVCGASGTFKDRTGVP